MGRSKKRLGLLISAGGLFVVLVGPLLIPVKPLKDTLPPEELGDGDSQFIEIDQQLLHVKKMGQGEPVFLLLHGFASSLYTWHAVMEPLSQIGTVIAYDRTGFGLSERPTNWQGKNPYSSETQVELATGLLDHFKVGKAILVGNSAGGTVAMQVALDHPERVAGLILVDPAVYRGGGAPGWLKPILATPQMRRIGPLFTRQILKFNPKLLKLTWHDAELIPPEVLALYQKPFLVENWDKALWEFTIANGKHDLVGRLAEFTLPTLVITGDDDRIVPTSYSIRLAGDMPNSSLKVITNAGHVPHEEKPEQFMEAVTQYLIKLKP
jgi:pimeloyl-ACP methyl ester carboxylesterase